MVTQTALDKLSGSKNKTKIPEHGKGTDGVGGDKRALKGGNNPYT